MATKTEKIRKFRNILYVLVTLLGFAPVALILWAATEPVPIWISIMPYLVCLALAGFAKTVNGMGSWWMYASAIAALWPTLLTGVPSYVAHVSVKEAWLLSALLWLVWYVIGLSGAWVFYRIVRVLRYGA